MARTLPQILPSVSDVLFPADLGAPVTLDSRGADGDTASHVLCRRGDRERARQLIDVGADVNAVGDMGQTPLHVAVAQEDPLLARLLAADRVSEFGDTARERARKKGGPIWEAFQHSSGS